MGQFNFIKLDIEGLYAVEPKCIGDNRGYFMETYNYEDFKKAGLSQVFVQDNQSLSRIKHPQCKLVPVLKGEVFDVVVDIRPGSKTYGKWHGEYLSEENKKQFYIPEGFAHGFLVLSEEAEFAYKCTDFYYPEDQAGISWNDKDLNIDWPIKDMEIILSEKDLRQQNFKDIK